MANNFDCSSCGVNIEIHCFYDSFLASIEFKDVLYKIGDYYALEYNKSSIDNHRVSKKAVYRHFENEISKRDFLELWNYHYSGEKSLSIDEAISFVSEYSGDLEIEDFFLPDGFKFYSVHGSSQGDYAKAICKPEEREYIENLLFNTPVSCRIEVDGEEYFIDEQLDPYLWDKEAALEVFKRMYKGSSRAYVISWVEKHLPEYPDYI